MDQKTMQQRIVAIAQQARVVSRQLSITPTAVKNQLLLDLATTLGEHEAEIIAANERDLAQGREKAMPSAMLNRLAITADGLKDMARGLREIAALDDPVGEISELRRRPSGIGVGRMRVPLGVICMIYEARPNVTIDAAALCLKTGNAVILRGGSEAIHSNLALAKLMHQVLKRHQIDPWAVQVLDFTEREAVDMLLLQEEYIDLVIPRGGEGLIRAVTAKSRIPVLKHYKGVCHAFIDEDADLDMAINIVRNAKVQKPGVCNALEGVLAHQATAAAFLPRLAASLRDEGVRLLGCARSQALSDHIEAAADTDWGREFLGLIMVVRVVDDMEEALAYIDRYGSRHTETIITGSYERGQYFLRRVDASAVMINASTRFNDGGEFGLGAEIGISTTKLHAYGPMGLHELTTRKFVVFGNGEIRG